MNWIFCLFGMHNWSLWKYHVVKGKWCRDRYCLHCLTKTREDLTYYGNE